MPKTVEIRIPVSDDAKRAARRNAKADRYETITGAVALLALGAGPRLRCVIHDGILTDYRSGRRVATLQAVKIEAMARLSTYHRLSDRQAAQVTLDRIVAKIGEAKTRAVIDAAPALNV